MKGADIGQFCFAQTVLIIHDVFFISSYSTVPKMNIPQEILDWNVGFKRYYFPIFAPMVDNG